MEISPAHNAHGITSDQALRQVLSVFHSYATRNDANKTIGTSVVRANVVILEFGCRPVLRLHFPRSLWDSLAQRVVDAGYTFRYIDTVNDAQHFRIECDAIVPTLNDGNITAAATEAASK